MNKHIVALVKYDKPLYSVRRTAELSHGLDNINASLKFFLKPNICFWRRNIPFPKWGVITTSRVVNDIVVILKEHGVDNITIGEGIVLSKVGDKDTPADSFNKLGYNSLKKKYGINLVNVHERPFEAVDLGDGITLNFNSDFLKSDFVINLPVLKTHLQTIVSLGIKNLKGVIDIESRKKCHMEDSKINLHYIISKLVNQLPKTLTIIDGIYSNEMGPAFDGNIKRSNILIGSSDTLSADMVGAKVLGYNPYDIPHLNFAAKERKRPLDLSDIDVVNQKIEDVASFHQYALPYNKTKSLPLILDKNQIKGLSIPNYDLSICTYCTTILPILHYALLYSWKGKAWDDVEILTGKVMKPTPGKKRTILLGKCMYEANKNNKEINEMIAVKGCPPERKAIVNALKKSGIEISPLIFDIIDKSIMFLMKKYENNPEFEESFFKIGS